MSKNAILTVPASAGGALSLVATLAAALKSKRQNAGSKTVAHARLDVAVAERG